MSTEAEIEKAREKVAPLADRLDELVELNTALRPVVFYLLTALQAAHLEEGAAFPRGYEHSSMGELWEEASGYVDRLAEKDPVLAVNLAITLISKISREPGDDSRELIYQWLRGDGPLLLAKPKVKEALLQSPKEIKKVLPLLTRYLDYDVSQVSDEDEAFSNPDAFLAVASLYFGLSLTNEDVAGNQALSEFREASYALLQTDKMRRLVDFYYELPDTRWLAKEIKRLGRNFKTNSE